MWYLWENEPTLTGRCCYECGHFFEWNSFHHLKHGRNGRESICKACKRIHNGWRSRCRRLHTPPAVCEACGDDTRPIQVDHDHETLTYRACLCTLCNYRYYINEQIRDRRNSSCKWACNWCFVDRFYFIWYCLRYIPQKEKDIFLFCNLNNR